MPEEKRRKEYVAQKETTDDDNTAIAVISTDTVDREHEVLLPKGVVLDNFLKNPVVMWVHDYRSFPVGSAKKYWVKQGRKHIKAKWEWAPTEEAQEVRQLWEGNFLNAVSVGFLPAENGSHPPTPDEVKKHPEWAEARRIYDNWELLEFSIVPVPANPDALAAAIKSKGLTISKELQDELGIDEVTYYADTDIANAVEEKLEPTLKPEETDNYIRIPVRKCKVTATITISAKEGIKGLYCGKIKKVRTYLFDKDKGWTMAKAKKWVKEHDDGKGCEVKTSCPVIVTNKVPVKVEYSIASFIDRYIKRKKGVMYID